MELWCSVAIEGATAPHQAQQFPSPDPRSLRRRQQFWNIERPEIRLLRTCRSCQSALRIYPFCGNGACTPSSSLFSRYGALILTMERSKHKGLFSFGNVVIRILMRGRGDWDGHRLRITRDDTKESARYLPPSLTAYQCTERTARQNP